MSTAIIKCSKIYYLYTSILTCICNVLFIQKFDFICKQFTIINIYFIFYFINYLYIHILLKYFYMLINKIIFFLVHKRIIIVILYLPVGIFKLRTSIDFFFVLYFYYYILMTILY